MNGIPAGSSEHPIFQEFIPTSGFYTPLLVAGIFIPTSGFNTPWLATAFK